MICFKVELIFHHFPNPSTSDNTHGLRTWKDTHQFLLIFEKKVLKCVDPQSMLFKILLSYQHVSLCVSDEKVLGEDGGVLHKGQEILQGRHRKSVNVHLNPYAAGG